jgi:hypothetical protein
VGEGHTTGEPGLALTGKGHTTKLSESWGSYLRARVAPPRKGAAEDVVGRELPRRGAHQIRMRACRRGKGAAKEGDVEEGFAESGWDGGGAVRDEARQRVGHQAAAHRTRLRGF